MGWIEGFIDMDSVQKHSPVLIGAAVIGMTALGFLFYRRRSTTYERVADNEALKAKLEAARLRQQEKYNQFIKESGDALKEKSEQLEKELLSRGDDKDDKSKGESLLGSRDYLPLGGGGGGTSYKPTKKRPCGPCGGGGCG